MMTTLQKCAAWSHGVILGCPTTFLVTGLVFFGLTCGSRLLIGQSDSQPRYAYIFGRGGQFVKIDGTTLKVSARWNLADISGSNAKVFPTKQAKWSIYNPVSDPTGARLLLSATTPETVYSEEPQFNLVALELPELKVVEVLNRDGPYAGMARVYFSHDGALTYVFNARKSIDVYHTDTFELDSRIHEKTYGATSSVRRQTPYAHLFANTSLHSDGTWYWSRQKYRIDNNVFMVEDFHPLNSLPPERLDTLKSHWNGRVPYYSVGHIRWGKAVISVKSLDEPRRFTWVYDLEAKQHSRVIETEESGFRLVGDGAKLRHLEHGRIELYDIESGAKIEGLSAKAVFGRESPGATICYSPEGDMQLALTNDGLGIYDLRGKTEPVFIQTSPPIGPGWTNCVFAAK